MHQPSKGVAIFGYLMIFTSLYQILILISGGYSHYSYLHQEYPPQVILLRYIVSWIIKIAGIFIGIGLLRLNPWARRIAIINSLLVILTVHLKHSYEAYQLHAQYLDQQLGYLLDGASFTSVIVPALWAQRAIDVVFGILLIFFFTRPKVKEQFKRS